MLIHIFASGSETERVVVLINFYNRYMLNYFAIFRLGAHGCQCHVDNDDDDDDDDDDELLMSC